MGKPVFIVRQASYPAGVLGWIVAQIMSRETGWEIDNMARDRARGALFHWFVCRPRLAGAIH